MTNNFERFLTTWVIRTDSHDLYDVVTNDGKRKACLKLDNVLSIYDESLENIQGNALSDTMHWRAYTVIKLFNSCKPFSEILKDAKLKTLIPKLKIKKLLDLADNHIGKCNDAILFLNQHLKKNNQKLCLVYRCTSDCSDLMRFIYDANNNGIQNIQFKVFLSDDLWKKMVFTNKSHFGDNRTMLI